MGDADKSMKSFKVVRELSTGARLAALTRLGDRELNLQTPTCLLYTRSGHVPHLSWTAFRETGFSTANTVICVPLSTLISAKLAIMRMGLRKFIGCPDDVAILTTFNDPHDDLPTGFNGNNACSVWNDGGKVSISHLEFTRDILPFYSGDAIQPMCDSDTPLDGTQAKRQMKAVNRTIDILDSCLNKIEQQNDGLNHYGSEPRIGSLWPTVVGGYGDAFQNCASKLAEYSDDCLDGFFVEGFHNFGPLDQFNFSSCSKLVSKAFEILPKDKPRCFPGSFSPSQVVDCVNFGFDLFDTSYATHITNFGQALVLGRKFPADKCDFDLVSVTAERFHDDHSMIVDNCPCYACVNFTKAYLHHLFKTKELLGNMLLMVHNLYTYMLVFERIRNRLRSQ